MILKQRGIAAGLIPGGGLIGQGSVAVARATFAVQGGFTIASIVNSVRSKDGTGFAFGLAGAQAQALAALTTPELLGDAAVNLGKALPIIGAVFNGVALGSDILQTAQSLSTCLSGGN